ncbi:hypothetical protein ACFQ51_35485 [Streptomyces kaempferi]
MPNGPLSLPARLYLLSWDTTRLKVTGETHLHHLVRAERAHGTGPARTARRRGRHRHAGGRRRPHG